MSKKLAVVKHLPPSHSAWPSLCAAANHGQLLLQRTVSKRKPAVGDVCLQTARLEGSVRSAITVTKGVARLVDLIPGVPGQVPMLA